MTGELDNPYEVSTDQQLPIPFKPGDYITIFDTIETHNAKVLFEGEVDRYVPDTGLIEFNPDNRSEDIGRATLREYIEQSAGVEIIKG